MTRALTESLVPALFALLALVSNPSGTPARADAIRSAERDAAKIPAARFAPLFGMEQTQTDLPVEAFELDRYLVTNQDFFRFVKEHPEWAPGKPALVFADRSYLKHWKGRKPAKDRRPVVFVSWHAANAFCESRGGRLPTVLEWEEAAAASEKQPNALKDPEFTSRILAGYGRPIDLDSMPRVGQGRPNYWGIHDLHGLVWEWTSDFNSIFVSGDNRQDGDKVQNLFCGNGATNASTREDYAAFMRYAMRSSLGADYTTMNLGFRCAYDISKGK